jgi:tetratricopeptide (TPR) repeat protein
VRWLLAIIVFAAAIAGSYEPPPTALERGNAFLNRGRLAEAILAYQIALRTPPESAEPAVRLGELYERRRLFERAEKAYQEARRLDRSNPDRWLDLGRVYAKTRRIESAYSAFEEAARLAPGHPQLAIARVDALIENGRFREADLVLREQLTRSAADRALHLRYASLLAPKEPITAKAHLEYVARTSQEDAQAGEARALRAALDALSGEPDPATLAVQVGNYFSGRGAPALAANAFEVAADLRPGYAEAYVLLGLSRLQIGDPRAGRAIEQGVQIDPQSSLGHYATALLLRAQGDLLPALREFERSAVSPTDLNAYGEVAATLGLLGEYDQALRLLARLYEQGGGKPEAAAALGRFYVRHALDSREAVRWSQEATDGAPEDPENHLLLGRAYLLDLQTRLSEVSLRRALELSPSHPVAHFHLAQAIEAQGRRSEAADRYATAFDLDEQGVIASRALASLEAIRNIG